MYLIFVYFWGFLSLHFCICGPLDFKLSEKLLLVEKEYICKSCNHWRLFALVALFLANFGPPLYPTNEAKSDNKFWPMGDCNLVQDVRAIRKKENWLDLLIFENSWQIFISSFNIYSMLNLVILSFLFTFSSSI